MLKSELLEIIANGENSGVEFKRDDVRSEQIAKEVVAMANLKGGILLLGVEDDGFRRNTQWHYPRAVVREVIVNALVHRDWTRSVDIEICVYSDRMEVTSPGALQNSMTIEKMLAGQRSPRNPLIVEVLRDYGYVDARGMGVRTKIVPLMKSINQTEPVFEATEDYLKTTLYRKPME